MRTTWLGVMLLGLTTGTASAPRERLTLKGHEGAVQAVAFAADGKHLATGGADATVGVWDATTGVQLLKVKSHKAGVEQLAFSPDGRLLVGAGADGACCVWEPATGKELMR